MRIRGQLRRSGRHFLLLAAALLGAAVVVLPSVASSETAPTIQASRSGLYFTWSPPTATINAGGSVTFTNPSSEVNHGVEWRPGNPTTPSCSPGVPVATAGTKWSGTCTFTQPGAYEFWCTVHGSEMKGTVTVNPNGTTTTTTTTTGTGTQTTTLGGGSSTATATPTGSNSQGVSGATGSPLAGSASSAVKLPSSQRGRSVRGSVEVSRAGAGGRLEVDLLAKSASLADASHAARLRVGRLVRSSLPVGKVSFSVPLNARARGASHRHGRLSLFVRLTIKTPSGASATVTRTVLVRP